MLRTDNITVKKTKECIRKFSELKNFIENSITEVASATRVKITMREEELHIYLASPLSLPSVNKIITDLQEKMVKVKKVNWEIQKVGIFEVGKMEILVS